MDNTDIAYISKLVQLAQDNDSNAFAELYARTYNKTYNYARHYLRDDYLAQDALQDIYVLALKNITKLSDPALFIAWLNRISFNVCYDMSRRVRSNNEEMSSPESYEEVIDDYPDYNPEYSFMIKDEKTNLHKGLNELPFAEKQVMVMRFFNNMKLAEIADALDISRSTVKRYIASAQSTLKNMMKG
jgi:RNA polymerase sigma-70 factor (ECF subfamily)